MSSRALVLLIALVTLAGSACTAGGTASSPQTSAEGTAPAPVSSAPDRYDVSDLVKQVRSGVVSVTQERVRLDLFGVPEEVPAGAGTGIVVDGEGLVLTNFHVIQGASRVIVTGAHW